jgi:valyl-tRNA synthetase
MRIAKNYTPAELEGHWYDFWERNGLFKSTPDHRKAYTIVIPPPNVTGMLHMGHMLNNTIQDILIRRKRMEGYNSCWVPGTDHASIATEAKVVQLLKSKGVEKRDLTREEFLKHAFEWKEKYGGIILGQLRKLGASCDWDRTRFTMDDDYYKAVLKVFVDLYRKGDIYRAYRMVNWDPQGLTALSDEEVIYKEKQGKLYHVRYAVEGLDDTFITIATTRPETILGDSAISVHPEDERYRNLVGKYAIVPLIGRRVPIIADSYVEMEFGTGALKVTPAHDMNDFEIGQRHQLETINILTEDGKMSEAAQLYVGDDRFVARKKIVTDLQEAGHVVKIEEHTHKVGHSERTDAVVEPRVSLQWWLSMKRLSKPALDAVMDDTVQLIPPKFKNTYRHWMENVKDWCISRQLWWGHQIPAWYTSDGEMVVAETAEEALEILNKEINNKTLVDGKSKEPYKMTDLKQDEDVLDTWFSSWLWPFQVFRGLTEPGNEEVKYYYPTNDLVTGPDILFFWVARMVVAGYEFLGDKPFNNVYLTGIIRDKLNRKMSKSLGNSPDPLDLIAMYGADGVRTGILLSSPAGNDLQFDTPLNLEKEPLVSKLCENGRNFCNKIWNAYRLVMNWDVSADVPPSDLDELALNWMEKRMNAAKAEVTEHFSKFRISDALLTVYRLIWDDFCSWFLEMMKPEFGNAMSQRSHQQVVDLFEELMQLSHPFTPFITEEVYQSLRERKPGESIMTSQLKPDSIQSHDGQYLDDFELVKESITAIRGFRNEKGLKSKDTIDLYINTPQAGIFKDNLPMFTRFLNTSNVTFADKGPAGAGSLRVRTTEFFIPLGQVDVAAEIEKLKADIAYTEGFLASVDKKLSNEKFVQSAPAQVVEIEKKKKADAEIKLGMLKETLAGLQ